MVSVRESLAANSELGGNENYAKKAVPIDSYGHPPRAMVGT